jgi:hypothetical protein
MADEIGKYKLARRAELEVKHMEVCGRVLVECGSKRGSRDS